MSGGPACCARHTHALGVQLPGPAAPPGQKLLLWGQAGPQAPQWLSSRDLVGSGYTETYKAANGSQVVEQQQRQVRAWAALRKAGSGRGGGGLRATHASSLLQGHCFYQGHVEGHHHSAASLSTCAGLRWVLQTWGVGVSCLPHAPEVN